MTLIAVIDDDASVRRSLERLLRASGYVVTSHASAADFLLSLETSAPACIVLDVHMPGFTGFDLMRALRARSWDSAVVVLTADPDPHTAHRALALGAVACLAKPFDETMLLDTIADAVDRRGSGKVI
jgi:FixJ family two-component response regulator